MISFELDQMIDWPYQISRNRQFILAWKAEKHEKKSWSFRPKL